jgi:DNA sulfur modification protein DndC
VHASILNLIARGALFVCNSSGGKDSQAMFLTLRELVPG